MKVERIQRVVIVVRDLEEAANRYGDLLGSAFLDLGIEQKQGVRSMVSEDWLVELISPIGPGSVAARFLERRGEGVMGVAFQVVSVDEARRHVQSKGFRVLNELDFGEVGIWELFKEIVLDPKETNSAPIIMVEAKPRQSASAPNTPPGEA